MQESNNRINFRIVLIIVFIIVGFRMPFIDNILVGEEGDFAALLFSNPPTSSISASGLPEAIVGNVAGRPLFSQFSRTIAPYLILERGLGSITRQIDIASLSFRVRTVLVRGIFFLLFLGGCLGAIPIVSRWPGRPKGGLPQLSAAGVLLFSLTTPLAVGGSIQPQLDGGLGVLLVGLAAWILLCLVRNRSLGPLLAGALVGLGRQEWAMAFAVAAIAVIGLSLIRRNAGWRQGLAVLAGVALGVVFSIALSPHAYLDGLNVMRRVTGTMGPVELFVANLRYAGPVAAIGLVAGVIVLANLWRLVEERPTLLIVFLAGCAIFSGAVLVGWPGDGFPRYYAPALVLLTYALVVLLTDAVEIRRHTGVLLLASCACGFLFNFHELAAARRAHVSISSSPGTDLRALAAHYAETAARPTDQDKVYIESVGIWLYYPNVQFLSRDLGTEGAKTFVMNSFPGWCVTSISTFSEGTETGIECHR